MSSAYDVVLLKIPVSDVEASSAFYAKQLGFDLEFVVAEYGWAQLRASGHRLALYQPGMGGGDGRTGGSVGFHLSLPESEFRSLAEKLASGGHLVDGKILTGEDGTTFVDVSDPDSNVVKVVMRP